MLWTDRKCWNRWSQRCFHKTKNRMFCLCLLAYWNQSPEDRLNWNRNPPDIHMNVLDNQDDIRTILRAVKYVVRLASTDAFQKYDAEVIRIPLPDCDDSYRYQSNAYYRCYGRHPGAWLYHTVGTSKMGPDTDPEAVVDDGRNTNHTHC